MNLSMFFLLFFLLFFFFMCLQLFVELLNKSYGAENESISW